MNCKPIKYFVIYFENYQVNYLFNLVKKTFEGFINEKILTIFPCSNIPLINISNGDLIEMNLINNLKSNIFSEISQIYNVNSIWNINYVKGLNSNKIENNCILIIQDDSNADFGILEKGKSLYLFQCKKTLNNNPKNYINNSDIMEKKN